jgi:hypothetical protein
MARLRLTPGLVRVISALFILFAFQTAVAAGAITGRVLDPEGRPVRGATVLLDTPLGVQTATTDVEGRFAFDAPAATGTRVLVEAVGFAAAPQAVPADGAPIEFRLGVAPYSESVVVSGSPVPQPLSESPAVTTVVDAAEVRARQLEPMPSGRRRALPSGETAVAAR